MGTFRRSCLHRTLAGCTLLALALGGLQSSEASSNIVRTTFFSAPPTPLDRSFDAARRALRDEGVTVLTEDKGAGTITGRSGTTAVSVDFQTQSNGALKVQFTSPDPAAQDLLQRVFNAYSRRMGR